VLRLASTMDSTTSASADKHLSSLCSFDADSRKLPPAFRLKKILADHNYLQSQHHYLNGLVSSALASIEAEGDEAEDQLNRIDRELEIELQTLVAAFNFFRRGSCEELSKDEVKRMNQYLGFPSEDADINRMMLAIDADSNKMISLSEFTNYVGHVGGTLVLFEARRRQINEKQRAAFKDAPGTSLSQFQDAPGDVPKLLEELLRVQLSMAAIEKEAQAYWRLVLPSQEFFEVGRLSDFQRRAIAHIRRLAKDNHEKALPGLQKRVASLGHEDGDLWMMLAWIRELSPIIVHIDVDKILQGFESDTHYRNQFETNTSGGLLLKEARMLWEKRLFGGCYEKAKNFERPKYGVLNVMNDYRGVVKCWQYGESYIILKDVRLRCTFSPEDSARLKAESLAVLDYYAHVLNEYSDAELEETLRVAMFKDSALLGDSEKVSKAKYKEAQIHGEIAFDRHVERLVAHTRHRDKGQGPRIEAVARKYGWQFTWMDEEQERRRHEKVHRLSSEEWRRHVDQVGHVISNRTSASRDQKPATRGGYSSPQCGDAQAVGPPAHGKGLIADRQPSPLPSPPSSDDADPFTLMTFNVEQYRHSKAGAAAIIRGIRSIIEVHSPDVICLQEHTLEASGFSSEEKLLFALVGGLGYEHVSAPTGELGVIFPIANCVLWKTNKFRHVQHGALKLSVAPIGKDGQRRTTPRAAAFAELLHLSSKQRLKVCSTHLLGGRHEDIDFIVESLEGRNRRGEQIHELDTWVNTQSDCQSCVIAGDFNSMLKGFQEGSAFRMDAQQYFEDKLLNGALKAAAECGYEPSSSAYDFDGFYTPFQTRVHHVLQDLGYSSAYGKSDAESCMKTSMRSGCVDWIYTKGLSSLEDECVLAAISENLSDHDAVIVTLRSLREELQE